eukprot:TRINITY_DN30216_c0_g1_i1.p1 TRINITY_DN30216_c0_g1~~TRINITY_DN30216_c0_g1_i1.p1  ORF type:complete len:458 (+),score=175.14 TRINITY_DN30216_c0_g1_i1:29-1402(+)
MADFNINPDFSGFGQNDTPHTPTEQPAASPSPARGLDPERYRTAAPEELRVQYKPQGAYSHIPIRRPVWKDEVGEGETLLIKEHTIRELLKATWGAGSHENQLDVTELVRSKVVKGGLKVEATNEVLCEPEYDPAPGQVKRLELQYEEQHMRDRDRQLEGVDVSTVEGRLKEAKLHNERLTHENVRLQEQLRKHERRENHYRDVEDRLKEELFKRKQLQQAILDSEGANVATRLKELERDIVRLRVQLKNEQTAVITEQKQRERVEADYNRLKAATQSGSGKLAKEQVQTLRQENQRLQQQLQDINRLNLNLQLTLKDQTEYDTLRASIFAMDNVDPSTGCVPMSSSHVRVRKSVLCSKCKTSVELWERQAISRGTAVTMDALRDLQVSGSTATRPLVGGSPFTHTRGGVSGATASPQPPTPLGAYTPYGAQQAPTRSGGGPGGPRIGYGGDGVVNL